jgi:hypothetical protein
MTDPLPPSLRIALCPGLLDGGGIGMAVRTLAGALADRGHSVDLLHLGQVADALPQGCTPVPIGRRSRGALPAARAYLRRARPHLVLTARDYVHVLMLAARRLAGLGQAAPALVWTFHTHRASEIAHQAGPVDRAADALMRRLAPRADAMVAVSDGVAQGLAADLGLPPGRVEVIANPVWTVARRAARLAPCPHPWLAGRAPLRRVAGLPEDPAGRWWWRLAA